MRAVLNHLSITEHFDDFARGIIDTKHVVYYLSFITFGLFLTAKSVDSERWRRLERRTSMRQMLKRILGLARMAGRRAGVRGGGDPVSEAGVAVVHERSRSPAWSARCSTSSASGATWRGRSPAVKPVRHARGRQRRSSCWRSSSAINYLGVAPQQALGPDGREAVHAVGPDARRSCRACRSRSRSGSSPRRDEFQRFRERLDEYQYASKQVSVEYIDATSSRRAPSSTRCRRSARSCSSTTAAPSA